MNIDHMKRSLDEDGYVLVPGVLDPTATAAYRTRLNTVYGALEADKRNVYPGGIGTTERLILNLHNKDEAFIDLADHPVMFPLIQHLLMGGSYSSSRSSARAIRSPARASSSCTSIRGFPGRRSRSWRSRSG
jgi:hypothetical protein